ncbi:uncharacterized protein LOC129234281 [Uloborus diversus]|uniref:uncharacterized protein LOC129234281 n=1 Tax=Uloborus diversus TaxID=327109 RepID=UPI00240936EC|nr:uncharacterized protein LOC129234281 [Uloborus diversus]
MTSTLKILKKKRGGLRTQTSKLCNKIDTALESEEIAAEQKIDLLSIYKDQLNEKYDCLKKLNSDIQDLTAESEFENEIETSEHYSERIIEFRYKITKFLNERAAESQKELFESSISKDESNSQSFKIERCMKLPKLTIHKFYGDSSCWLEFWGQFSNAIDKNKSLSPIDKFSYLKSLLGGSAYNAVAGFSLTAENYKSAVDLLKNRYGRNDLVINAHME